MNDNQNTITTLSDNPYFEANMSSDEIYLGQDLLTCLTDVVNDKAPLNHTHDGYASQSDLELLEDVVDTKANATHAHSEYASSTHTHENYATMVALDTLGVQVNGKADANHTHTEYASTSHTHDEYAANNHVHSNYAEATHTHDDYALATHTHTAFEIGAATSGHNHDNDYADINHNHDISYATVGHDHDEDYASIDHTHSEYATTTALDELSTVVSNKANASHNHDNLYYTETEVNTLLANKSNSTHNHDTAYDVKGSSASALASANTYTDSKIDALVGEGASTTLDTIGEISSAIEDNQDMIDTLNSAIGNKANASDLSSHTNNSTIHITSTERNNWNIAKTHADSAHAPSNAEKNQNAFSNIAVGNTTIAADTTTDTITLVAGSNVTLTPNVEGDSVTIASTNTVYTHPTTAGNKHIPAGGSSGQILRWSADGTAVWGNDNNTTYSNATQSSSGLMSDADKIKLDGIAVGANKYVLPSAGSSLGGVKTGGDVTISSGVITVNDDSHNHIISNIDGLQSALNGKAASGHTHSAESIIQMAEELFGTNYQGGVEYSYGSGSGKNVLTEISNMPQGLHTVYAISGTTGNPKTNESFRFLIHKTSGTIGWILAWDAQGSLFTNYQSASNTFKGWKCVYDANPSALWTGGYYMSSSNGTPQTVKPSKKLSECRNGWVLVWSDYDPDTSTKNNTDIHHDYVFKKNCAGANWSGQCMICDIPRYMGSNANDVDTERRILKAIYIHDDRIEGSYQGAYDERNDVVLRTVYEW